MQHNRIHGLCVAVRSAPCDRLDDTDRPALLETLRWQCAALLELWEDLSEVFGSHEPATDPQGPFRPGMCGASWLHK